jgi:homoserine O-succinyltransferase
LPLELQLRSGSDQATRPPQTVDAAPVLEIALINNMPDSALEGTESQFNALLTKACGTHSVRLRYSSLPEVPRGRDARARIAEHYWSFDQLLNDPPDAVIVTGTEPKTPRLRDEPYWRRLVEVIEFADANLISSVWSCLAAHAAVLHLDRIERQPLPVKRFGVYDQRVVIDHALTHDLATPIQIPHSRWNDLPLEALSSAGYQVLTCSQDGVADLFVKQRRSLLVFFQGHPEYEERTLLKEYQRDVARFISGEYREYPQAPPGYLGPAAQAITAEFERKLGAGEFLDPLAAFPFTTLAASIQKTWMPAALQIYRNWLEYIASHKYKPSRLA